MLKRRSWYGVLPKNSSEFSWENCAIDFVKFEGRRGGKRFSISQKECMLMKLLVERENLFLHVAGASKGIHARHVRLLLSVSHGPVE